MSYRFIPKAVFGVVASGAFAQNLSGTKSGNAFNPDISVNMLTLYGITSHGGDPDDGLALQEAEFQFVSDVDPYFRASALFSVSRDQGAWGIDPEEVFVETTSLPALSLRLGKFKAMVGRHNALHTHAYPFLDAPLINTMLLGKEGLNEAGVSAAYLIPTQSWFSELTAQVLQGDGAEFFGSPARDDVATNVHWKNLIEHSDALTSEIGLTGAFGRNSAGGESKLYGVDYTMKYRPLEGGKYRSLIFALEYLDGQRDRVAEKPKLDGLDAFLKYQFLERWNAGFRFEAVGLAQKDDQQPLHRTSGLVGFDFSEFSGLRAQYDVTSRGGAPTLQHFGIQLNITMGAHPAHAY